MIVKLHSETFHGLDYTKLRARRAALEAQYPGSTVTTRRLPRYGFGFTITVKGEGQPTKVQTRAHCQFCGRHQVVTEDRLVLHGYERPGHGWIYGRCPGVGQLPLQKDEAITRAALATSEQTLARHKAATPKLEKALATAKARYDAEEPGYEYLKPHKPYQYPEPKGEELEKRDRAYAAKLAAWYEQHPVTAKFLNAREAVANNARAIRVFEGQVDHFKLLLSWKLLGTPYLEVAK